MFGRLWIIGGGYTAVSDGVADWGPLSTVDGAFVFGLGIGGWMEL